MSIQLRAGIAATVSVLALGGVIATVTTQGAELPATEVQLEDTAGVIHEPDLLDGVDGIRFNEPTTVAVYTVLGGEDALTDDYALNDAVLQHARTERPDWLSENRQVWADDLFIIGLDPEGRLVGTYFGENRKLDREIQEEIQEATKEEYRDGQWTAGTISGIESAAGLMNRSFLQGPLATVVLFGLAFSVIGGAWAWFGTGYSRARKAREARAAGDRSMANVVRDYDETEIHARLIPAESRYGGAVLAEFGRFTTGFRELTELGNRARSIPERRYTSPSALATLAAYQHRAESLDALDDVIADTATLLNLDSTWPQAWDRQTEPLREDLARVEPLLSRTLQPAARGTEQGQALREFTSQALADLQRMRGEIETRALDPDDALDLLRGIRDELSRHLDRLSVAVARHLKSRGRAAMSGAMRRERGSVTTPHTIIDVSSPPQGWFTVASFQTGYTQGHQEAQRAESQSSSGSTAGYTPSSGGSFSGSGSSSRF